MDDPSTTHCPRCGAPKIGGQVYGLCARCLGALNFTSDTSPSDGAGGVEFSREDLEASFPQLEILEPLGRGGMGVVYKARQKELGRVVALKLLPPERVADPQFAERFRREAQALASLTHPNIVAIHDFGQTNGLFYLLMEFVDGVNLRQAMNAGRFTPDQALAIVPPVCEALQFAHEHGIVHRDIKPENLLLDKRGHVKIADFGIAKMLGQDASDSDVSESQPAGTPQYMAPEQQQPGHADHRADIYSLGVVLYEMLTGELPAGPLQPPSRRLQIDVRIDQIVLRALEASPEMRFGTAAEFRSSVEAVTRQAASPPIAPKASLLFSALALWGAAWAAMCLISLSFLDMAWFGGFGSTVLGWMAVSEIQRSDGRVRGLWLAVFDVLLFPLLTVNAAMVAVYAKFITPIRNQPYPAMVSPSWPFIVIGLGLLTLLLVVLLDFLVVRAVWRRLNKSHTAEGVSANSWTWRIVVGGLLSLVGGSILLGTPVINELVDDLRLTQAARDHHQEHERTSQHWSDLTTDAAEAMIALEAAKKVENTAEVERLTRESQALRDSTTHAERALNLLALQKHASERERSALLYLLGGGLIATGLLACFREASRSRRLVAAKAGSPPMSGIATVQTPAELASIWNQFFCYRTRGPLMLEENLLTHSHAGGTLSIPLQAIRDVSIGYLPRLMNLAGLSVLSISYEDDGETRQVLISPIEGLYQFSQEAVSEWCAAIRTAVIGATGRKPTTTPPEHLGIPQSSRLLPTILFVAAAVLLLVLFWKLFTESLQTATPSMETATTGFPVSSKISRNHHSVLVVQDEDDETLDYVLYFPGDILVSSSGTRNQADQTWQDEGVVKLKSGRKFAYSRKAISPDELQINGEIFDLQQGRLFVLQVDGNSLQLPVIPTLAVARDPEAVGRLVIDEQEREKNGLIAFSLLKVDVPAGTHDLSLRLRREWEKESHVGIETSLHFVAGASPDPAKRMPKNGAWMARQMGLVRGADEFSLIFSLPDEIPVARLHEAAADVMRRYRSSEGEAKTRSHLVLGSIEPIRLAAITHSDGWECHLYLRAVKLDEFGNPRREPDAPSESAAKADPATPADPVDPTSDLLMETFDFGFAFTGVGEETRLRDDVRLAIERFVQKVDSETGQTPDVRMDPKTRVLTLTGPPEQQRLIAEMVAVLKKNAAVEAVPFTAWGEESKGLQMGLGFRPGERRVYHPGETVTLVVRLKNVGKDKAKHSYRPDLLYRNPPNVTGGDGQPVVFEGVPVPPKGHKRSVEVELTRGGEMDLWELKLALRPPAEAGTQRPAWTLFGTGIFQLGYANTGKLALEIKEPEVESAFTAWGTELGGLQAGIGFRAAEKRRVFHPGETVPLVVRIRNVRQQPVLFRHLSHYFLQTPPVVKDRQEKPVALQGAAPFSGKPKLAAYDLAPDQETELAELTIELLPESAKGDDKAWTLRGVGKHLVRYEQIEGVIGPGNGDPDALLGYMLDTGALELEVTEVADALPAKGSPAETTDLEPTFLKRPEDARVNVAFSPKFDARVFVSCAVPITSTIVDHHVATEELVLSVGTRNGVRFGHAFQILSADSKEHIGVAKVMELESTRCVAKVVSVVPQHSAKSLKGMAAACTPPLPNEGQPEIKKQFDKDIWQTESLENKLIRELLEAHGNETRILIIHE